MEVMLGLHEGFSLQEEQGNSLVVLPKNGMFACASGHSDILISDGINATYNKPKHKKKVVLGGT